MAKTNKTMTPIQFKAGLSFLNMSYSGFARYTGKTTQSVYGYASGRQAIPKLVADTLTALVGAGQVSAEFQRKRRTREQMKEAFEHGEL